MVCNLPPTSLLSDLFSRCPLSGDWNLSLERMHLLVGGLATEFAPWIRSGGFRVVLERPRTAVHSRQSWRLRKKMAETESPKRFWTPKIVTGFFAVQPIFWLRVSKVVVSFMEGWILFRKNPPLVGMDGGYG